MNIDASTNTGNNVIALVARDNRGSIACLATKCLSGLPADSA